MLLCPIHPEPPFNRAEAYRLSRKMDRALDDYQTAWLLNPGDAKIEAFLRKHGRDPLRRG